MSQQFTLTAQLRLQPPPNVGQVINQIRNQLGGITVDLRVKAETKQLQNVQKDLNNVKDAAEGAKKGMTSFGEQASIAAKRFFAFSIATTGFLKLVNAIGSGIKDAIEFEREVFKISQVTGTAVRDLSNLTDEVTRLSKSLGVSSKELLNVAQVLAQAGLQSDEIKKSLDALAKSDLSATFDNMASTGEAAIAIFAQFGVKADQLDDKLSAINAVAGKFAVESSDLTTAIRRTGGAFQAAGGSLEELLALFTSVRATTRESAESIATGFRTIFTRLQRIRTVNFLSNIGVQLRDFEGQFVGPYEAIRRLSEALKEIPSTDPRFAQVIEELGGFRQISKVIPLIQKFGESQKALIVAQQGQGSIARDAAQAQGSLAVQLAKVGEEFDALIRKVANNESFQGFIKLTTILATSLIRVADALTPLIPLIGAFATFKGLSLGKSFIQGFSGKSFSGGGNGRLGLNLNSGGLVPGQGNGDTVPANLTPGEYVLRKSAVQALGVDNLHSLNRNGGGKIPRKGYAKGGKVEASDTNALFSLLDNAKADAEREPSIAKRDRFLKNVIKSYYSDGTIIDPNSSTVNKFGVSTGAIASIYDNYSLDRNDTRSLQKGLLELQSKQGNKVKSEQVKTDKDKARQNEDILLPPKSELEFGAVYLQRKDRLKKLGLYEPDVTMESSVAGFKGKRVPLQLKYHQAEMSEKSANNFITQIESELPDFVSKIAHNIAPNFEATNVERIPKVPGQESISGFLFEGALQSLGGPYNEIDDDKRRFDFPKGLGKLGGIFPGLPSGRPVDAKLTAGTQNSSLIEKAKSKLLETHPELFKGFNKGGLVQHFAKGGKAIDAKAVNRVLKLINKKVGFDFNKAGNVSKLTTNAFPAGNFEHANGLMIPGALGQGNTVAFNKNKKQSVRNKVKTIAHEFFHAADYDPKDESYLTEGKGLRLLTDPLVNNAREKQQFLASKGVKYDPNYYNDPKEVMARAFANFITNESSDEEAGIVNAVLSDIKKRKGFAKGGHVALSSDTLGLSPKIVQQIIGEVGAGKYPNIKKVNLVHGVAGSGKSTFTNSLGAIPLTNLNLLKEIEELTVESASGKLENINSIIDLVNKTGGTGTVLDTAEDLVSEQREKRLQSALSGAKLVGADKRSPEALKGTNKAPVKIDEEFLSGLKAAITNINIVQRKKFAKGGAASDTVPALLTPGEFVFTKETAKNIGYSNLDKMNKMRGYAKGGKVGGVQRFSGGGPVKGIEDTKFDGTILGKFKNLELQAIGAATGLQTLNLYMGDTNTEFSQLVGFLANVSTQFSVLSGVMKGASSLFGDRRKAAGQARVDTELNGSKTQKGITILKSALSTIETTVPKTLDKIKKSIQTSDKTITLLTRKSISNDPTLATLYKNTDKEGRDKIFNSVKTDVLSSSAGAVLQNKRNQDQQNLVLTSARFDANKSSINKNIATEEAKLVKLREKLLADEQAKFDKGQAFEGKTQLLVAGGAAALGVAGQAFSSSGQGQIASGNFESGKLNQQIGGTASSAGTGASAGAGIGSFFGPVGTAVGAGLGAIAGGLYGLASATSEAEKQIASVKFDQVFKKFTSKLNSGVATIGDVNQFSKTANSRLLSTSGDDFQTTLAGLEANALSFDQALSKSATAFVPLSKSVKDVDGAVDKFQASLDPETLRLFARITNSTSEEVKKRFALVIKSATELAASQGRLKVANQNLYIDLVRVNSISKIFNDALESMTRSVEQANVALEPFSVKVSDSASAVLGNPGNFTDPKIFEGAVKGNLVPILSRFIPQAEADNLGNRAIEANSLISQLPDILARSRTIGTSDNPTEEVLKNLKPGTSPELVNAIEQSLSGILGSEGKPENLISALEQNLFGVADSIGESVKRASGIEALAKASATYVKILNEEISLRDKIRSAEGELLAIRIKGVDIQEQYNDILRKVDDPRVAGNFGDNERESRQRLLLGTSNAAATPFDPQAIFNSASSALSQIRSEEGKGEKLSPAALSNFQTALGQSIAGLENLADVSAQLAPAMRRLEEATKKRQQAEGLIDSIAGGGSGARQNIGNLSKTIQAISKFQANNGAVGPLDPTSAAAILGQLQQIPDLLKATGVDPVKLGTAIRKPIADQLRTVLKITNPGDNNVDAIADALVANLGLSEQDKVVKEIDKVVATGKEANRLLALLKDQQIQAAQIVANAVGARASAQAKLSLNQAAVQKLEAKKTTLTGDQSAAQGKLDRIKEAAELSGLPSEQAQSLLDNRKNLELARAAGEGEYVNKSLKNVDRASLLNRAATMLPGGVARTVGQTYDENEILDLVNSFASEASDDTNIKSDIASQLRNSLNGSGLFARGNDGISRGSVGQVNTFLQEKLFSIIDNLKIKSKADIDAGKNTGFDNVAVAANYDQIQKLLEGIGEVSLASLETTVNSTTGEITVLTAKIDRLGKSIKGAVGDIDGINAREKLALNGTTTLVSNVIQGVTAVAGVISGFAKPQAQGVVPPKAPQQAPPRFTRAQIAAMSPKEADDTLTPEEKEAERQARIADAKNPPPVVPVQPQQNNLGQQLNQEVEAEQKRKAAQQAKQAKEKADKEKRAKLGDPVRNAQIRDSNLFNDAQAQAEQRKRDKGKTPTQLKEEAAQRRHEAQVIEDARRRQPKEDFDAMQEGRASRDLEARARANLDEQKRLPTVPPNTGAQASPKPQEYFTSFQSPVAVPRPSTTFNGQSPESTSSANSVSTVFGEISRGFAEQLRGIFSKDLVSTDSLQGIKNLTDALHKIPTKFEFTHEYNGTLNVLVNGAEAFKVMEPKFQDLVMGKVQEAMDHLLSKNFGNRAGKYEPPKAKPVEGGDNFV